MLSYYAIIEGVYNYCHPAILIVAPASSKEWLGSSEFSSRLSTGDDMAEYSSAIRARVAAARKHSRRKRASYCVAMDRLHLTQQFFSSSMLRMKTAAAENNNVD